MLLAEAMGETIQVYYALNMNGRLIPDSGNTTLDYPENTDVVIYFGDSDCLEIAREEAEKGTAYIALSCDAANSADGLPHLRIARKTPNGGCLLYYNKINIASGIGIAPALQDAIKMI